MFAVLKITPILLVLLFGILVEALDGEQDEKTASAVAKYIVSVKTKANNLHICVGNIYNTRFILSSANCMFSNEELRISGDHIVVAGIKYDGGKESVQTIDVLKFIPHEDYNLHDEYKADIGLILLEGNLEENAEVKRIPLANKAPDSSSTYMVLGWGIIEGGTKLGKLNYLLMKTGCGVLTKFTDIACLKNDKGSGICHGDTGAPLITSSEPHKLMGIAISGSHPCGVLNLFTKINKQRTWIDGTVTTYTRRYLNDAPTKFPSISLVLLAAFHTFY